MQALLITPEYWNLILLLRAPLLVLTTIIKGAVEHIPKAYVTPHAGKKLV